MCQAMVQSLLLLPAQPCKTPYHRTCRAWLQSEHLHIHIGPVPHHLVKALPLCDSADAVRVT